MTDLTDIKFDHDVPSVKSRVLNGSVTYTQGNVVFSAGYEPLKWIKQPPPVVPKKKKAAVVKKPFSSARERAADKLEGFKDDEKPDAVKVALREDASAKHADELAE